MIDNATSNNAADNIALLDRGVERLPGRSRRQMLIRMDGAGFSHELLEHIANGGGVKGRRWEFSAGWSCTDREIDAIAELPDQAWTPAIEQNGEPVENAFVADLTGLLDLGGWQEKIPGLRVLVRDEPLHPRYRKRATDREKALGRRFQLIVTNTQVGQIAWLDARHRCHVHVENDVKQAKDLGLNERLFLLERDRALARLEQRKHGARCRRVERRPRRRHHGDTEARHRSIVGDDRALRLILLVDRAVRHICVDDLAPRTIVVYVVERRERLIERRARPPVIGGCRGALGDTSGQLVEHGGIDVEGSGRAIVVHGTAGAPAIVQRIMVLSGFPVRMIVRWRPH